MVVSTERLFPNCRVYSDYLTRMKYQLYLIKVYHNPANIEKAPGWALWSLQNLLYFVLQGAGKDIILLMGSGFIFA